MRTSCKIARSEEQVTSVRRNTTSIIEEMREEGGGERTLTEDGEQPNKDSER